MKKLRRVCAVCQTPYYFFPHEKNEHGFRKCKNCKDVKHVKWTCDFCGRQFDSRTKLEDHKREQKQKGEPCVSMINIRVRLIKCPFCNNDISTSKNVNTLRESLATHRCPGVEEVEKLGWKLRGVVEFLNRLKSRNNIVNQTIVVDMEKLLQVSWVQSFFDKYQLPEGVILSDLENKLSKVVLSFETKSIFIFDGEATDKIRLIFNCLKWNIFDLKWSDCIQRSEEIEKEIVESIRSKQ